MVTFQPEGEEPFVFVGSRYGPRLSFITTLRARELMHQSCIGFLASVINTTHVVLIKLEETRIVCKFLDMFPEELPGLPSCREIEFVIELVPGTEPVHKAPYRMAPAKLNELKF